MTICRVSFQGRSAMDELVPPFYKSDGCFETLLSSVSGSDNAFLASYLSNTTAPWKTIVWSDLLQQFHGCWINVKKEPVADDFDGKLVVLDFFTYCCINCMHILPYLKRLESAFDQDRVQIIGIHSAKFLNEKSTVNVANAVSRYEIDHPVINDVDCILWHKFGVQCWPTVAVVSPDGKVIFWFVGESRMSDLEKSIGKLLEYYGQHGSIRPSGTGPVIQGMERFQTGPSKAFTGLKFPGKVAVSPSGHWLAVSDTGHHRIVIWNLAHESSVIIGGSGHSGSKDGPFPAAEFHAPQGICWMGEETVFVADTENHLIRKVDLKNQTVTTIGGVGRQGQDLVGGKEGQRQEISSPWDVAVAEIEPGNPSLLIAAAGTHQIWILPLASTISIGKRKFEPEHLYCLAGSGHESAKNNSYPHQAAFAQPSGLSVDGVPSSVVYVADSESSSIRSVDLKSGAVKNVVGGDRNPENLFAFGDVDGVGFDAKLQHPLGVAYYQQNGTLYIADSYNHKIKAVEPKSRACQTVALDFNGVELKGLNEPGGICIMHPKMYIADTNNHRVLVMDVESLRVEEIRLDRLHSGPLEATDSSAVSDGMPRSEQDHEVINVPSSAESLKIRIRLDKSGDLEFSEGAPHAWKISSLDAKIHVGDQTSHNGKLSGDLVFVNNEASLPDLRIDAGAQGLKPKTNAVIFQLEVVVYLCDKKSGVCSVHSKKYSGRLHEGKEGADAVVVIDWKLARN